MLMIMTAFLAPWIAPYTLGGLEENRLLEAPSWNHWMGTDGLGRDLLTRVLYGARVSIAVGLGTAAIALIIGTIYGLIAGFKGGNWDQLMMRIVDIFYGLPDMLIFILLSLLLGELPSFPGSRLSNLHNFVSSPSRQVHRQSAPPLYNNHGT